MSTNERNSARPGGDGCGGDRVEFDRLCRALADGPEPAVRAAIEQRLFALAGNDVVLREEVCGLGMTLAAMATERELFATCIAPVEASECADEEFAAAARGAVAAERAIRARLQVDRANLRCSESDAAGSGSGESGAAVADASAPSLAPAPSLQAVQPARGEQSLGRCWFAPRDWVVALATAAAVLLVGWWVTERGPSLSTTAPGQEVLGPRLVVVTPQLGADARALSWSAVPGAAAYDAVIVDTAGQVVLERAAVHGANTQWQISQDDLGRLRQRGPVRLRVRALDGLGLPFATSGDLRLDVR